MPIQDKRWEVSPRAPESHFAQFSEIPKLIVQILYNRGFTIPQEVNNFLAHQWADDDPFNLKDMAPAVDRLNKAIADQEMIAIYGDYDADGVTASALMMQLLTALQAKAQVYIPNRFEEGYGLNKEALAELAQQGVKVVLTVDCGIRSVEEVAFGNSLGLDIIITDHHSLGPEMPPAMAAINPKQTDCVYPFKELAGVGLAYKLAQALLRSDGANNGRHPAEIREGQFLDLVALGTVADLAPLYDENRKLVSEGIQKLNHSLRPGLAALMAQSKANSGAITAGTIGFTIGPRLNAAGRLDSALAAYQLLMATNELQARKLADQLDTQNRERQRLTNDTVQMARQAIVEADIGQQLHFISHSAFNPGVVGLAASRLSEEYYRPVLVAEEGAEFTKGSARSIAEFHITDALDQCADLLERYGGHAAAAGFTVRNQNVAALRGRLQEIAHQQLADTDLRATITIDGEINLRGVKASLIQAITDLRPFGYGNPTPRFLTRELQVKFKKAVGHEGQHLRLVLHDGRQDWSAIAFRQGFWFDKLNPRQKVDAVYNLEFNEWRGQKQMQLNVKDLRPANSQQA